MQHKPENGMHARDTPTTAEKINQQTHDAVNDKMRQQSQQQGEKIPSTGQKQQGGHATSQRTTPSRR